MRACRRRAMPAKGGGMGHYGVQVRGAAAYVTCPVGPIHTGRLQTAGSVCKPGTGPSQASYSPGPPSRPRRPGTPGLLRNTRPPRSPEIHSVKTFPIGKEGPRTLGPVAPPTGATSKGDLCTGVPTFKNGPPPPRLVRY